MTDPKLITHEHDPETSTTAAVDIDEKVLRTLKQALIVLLDEKPRTGDELTAAYFHRAGREGWPLYTDRHNIKRRLSDLHAIHHVIKESGKTRPSNLGKPATVWELAVPTNTARLIVAMKGTA